VPRRVKNQLIRPKSVRQARSAKVAEGQFSGIFEQDCGLMQTILQHSADVKTSIVKSADLLRVGLFMYSDMINTDLLSNNVIRPLQTLRGPIHPEKVTEAVISASETTTVSNGVDAANAMSEGAVVLVLEGQAQAVLVHILQVEHRPINRAQSEDVIIGPHESFTEVLATNIATLRRLLATRKLKVRSVVLGSLSRTSVAVTYIEGLAQSKLVDEVLERLRRVDVDHIEGAAYLIDFLEDNPTSIFPQLRVTERPHRVVAALTEGRVAIMAMGDPTALIVPTFLPEYVQSSEDYFERTAIGTFLRCLRLVSAFLAVFLPGLWIALVVFHHGVIPRALFNSIVAGRENVPLPSILEAFLLLFAFDIVIEASTRLPNAVGQAIGIVGAIILGQSAVQANLVSPAMTIVVALAGLATYTVPSPSLLSPMRLLKYLVLLVSSVFGLYGIIWVVIALSLHLTSMRSFGYPFVFPVAPFDPKSILDIIARPPLYRLKQRPVFLAAENPQRMADNLRPAPGKEPDDAE